MTDSVSIGRRRLVIALTAGVLIAVVVIVALRYANRHQFVEYQLEASGDIPTMIAAAPDGSVWFTIDSASAVGRIEQGKLLRLPKQGENIEPIGLAVAQDSAAWFTDGPSRQVARIGTDGKVTGFTVETPIARLAGIAVAPDGAVWFAEDTAYSITRLKDGVFKRHVIGSIRGRPHGVAVAPDGTVWATLQAANQLVSIGADGAMRSFDIPTRGSAPSDLVVDARGVVWFLEFRGNKLGRLENAKFQEFSLGESNVGPTGLAVGADGAIWLAMFRLGSLGRFAGGKLERIELPRSNARPFSVSVDRAGNVWYTDTGGYVGMLKR